MEMYISILIQVVFWVSVFCILVTYGFYPFLMAKIGAKRRENRTIDISDRELPQLHVVMAMYNEASVIRATLNSIVDSHYPTGKLTVWIGSDNSTDGSDEIVQSIAQDHDFVNLRVFGGRSGKIKIINQLIEQIPHDDDSVLLLCDANVVWSKDLARNLARHFKDDEIGVVASCVIDSDISQNGIAAEEDTYVNIENAVKFAEGEIWGKMMGAFGACYALRRSAFEAVPEHFNVDDFYLTMACYEKGFDGIVDLEAVCYEAVSEDISEEFRRKKRISKGNFQNLGRFFAFLLPWNCGLSTFFAFWAHKGFRWFGPLLLVIILLSSLYLSLFGHWIYLIAFGGMVGSLGLIGVDKMAERFGLPRHRIVKFVRYFYAMNFALLMGAIEFCKGISNSVWEPTKRVPVGEIPAVPPQVRK